MDLFVRFGKTVRRLRTNAGFSQETFADLVGMHRNYIGTVERGETNISIENIHRIARGLRITIAGLFQEREGSAEDTPRSADTAGSTRTPGDQHERERTDLLRPALDRVAEARQAIEEAAKHLLQLEAGQTGAGATKRTPRRRSGM